MKSVAMSPGMIISASILHDEPGIDLIDSEEGKTHINESYATGKLIEDGQH